MTDAELVKRETNIPLEAIPAGMRDLTVRLCRLSMGEMLTITEQVEAVDARKGELLRKLWNQRRDCAELRSTLASLKAMEVRHAG